MTPRTLLPTVGAWLPFARPLPNPFPGLSVAEADSADQRAIPPELGPDALAVLSGPTFMYSNAWATCRRLDRRPRPRGHPPVSAGADPQRGAAAAVALGVEHFSAAFFLTNPELPGLPATRSACGGCAVGDGMHERIELRLHRRSRCRSSSGWRSATTSPTCSRSRSGPGPVGPDHPGARRGRVRAVFTYRNGDSRAQTRVVSATPADRIDGDDLVWELDLAPRQSGGARCTCRCAPGHAGGAGPARLRRGLRRPGRRRAARWLRRAGAAQPTPDCCERIAGRRRGPDRAADRPEVGQRIVLPAAGLPWFLTVFGRDTLITAYQTVVASDRSWPGARCSSWPRPGHGRATTSSDEEPGKILHEIRSGELTRLGDQAAQPVLRRADATQLWLILLSEYWRWTGDDELVRQAARQRGRRAALDRRVRRPGRRRLRRVRRPARPRGWATSAGGTPGTASSSPTGTIPVLPIATCEIQGYTYDAKLRIAELADGPLGDPALARGCAPRPPRCASGSTRTSGSTSGAATTRSAWTATRTRIDSMTSNMGHLLWSGIVPAGPGRTWPAS